MELKAICPPSRPTTVSIITWPSTILRSASLTWRCWLKFYSRMWRMRNVSCAAAGSAALSFARGRTEDSKPVPANIAHAFAPPYDGQHQWHLDERSHGSRSAHQRLRGKRANRDGDSQFKVAPRRVERNRAAVGIILPRHAHDKKHQAVQADKK